MRWQYSWRDPKCMQAGDLGDSDCTAIVSTDIKRFICFDPQTGDDLGIQRWRAGIKMNVRRMSDEIPSLCPQAGAAQLLADHRLWLQHIRENGAFQGWILEPGSDFRSGQDTWNGIFELQQNSIMIFVDDLIQHRLGELQFTLQGKPPQLLIALGRISLWVGDFRSRDAAGFTDSSCSECRRLALKRSFKHAVGSAAQRTIQPQNDRFKSHLDLLPW
ncbi:MAG: hypothetical protein OXF83_07720 [Anaerolineaceae bacterium]|nr:hypothetical protein [Anaerolineaceae bacterium]